MKIQNTSMTTRAAGAVAALALTVGAAAVIASPGTADTPSTPNAPDLASASSAVADANSGARLGLDTGKARVVDMAKAPAGLAGQTVLVIPSAKGPCILRKVGQQVAEGLVQNDALSCGAGIAPTVSIGPEGTIGALEDLSGSVEVIDRDGTSRAAEVGSDGVWFAPADASAAIITSGGSSQKLNLR